MRWKAHRLRMLVVATFLAVVAVSSGLWLAAGRAGAPSATVKMRAYWPEKGDLQIAVVLNRNQAKELTGTLRVDLLNANGTVLATASEKINQKKPVAAYRFPLKTDRNQADKLHVRSSFGGKSQTVALGDVRLVKAHETTLTASSEFFTGSSTAMQLEVCGVRSLTKTVPLPDADVVIRLKEKKTHELFRGTTNAEGRLLAQFTLPDLPPGTYEMEVVTKSVLGEETLKRNVRIRGDAKVLLVTDKPIYQPGQLMHIRALALRPYDLKPVANSELVFEVEDSKGNKVYKKTYKTSDFGVASVDFQLADEVNMGQYQIRATLGQTQAQKTVTVKRYVLPKFKVNVKTSKTFFRPKATVEGSIQADYFFGKPIARGKVEITASTFDVAFRKFARLEVKTDDNGHAKFEIKLPEYFVGQPLQKGNAIVKLDVKITDSADQVVKVTKSYPVSDQPIKISVLPEGGKLVPDMENRVFVAAIYPDGSPAQCDVVLFQGKKLNTKDKLLGKLKTNAVGLAEFRFTPKAKDLRQGAWGQRQIEMLGGEQRGWGPQILYDLCAAAKDTNGATANVTTTLNAHPLGENVLLRLDKAIYQPGDRVKLDVRTSAGLPTVYLDIVRGGQVLLSKWLDVKKGQAQHNLDLPAALFGSLEIHAYQMLNSGEIIRDSRVVYVQPRNDLNIKVEPNQSVFAPGENGRIRFHVTDNQGKPTAAALGVIIVDEAVYALSELQPGLEKVYFTLQKELLKPQVQAKFKPADNLPVLIRQRQLPPARQQVAQALLTAVKPAAPKRWHVAPELDRQRQFQGQTQQIGWGLWNYAWNNGDFLHYNKTAKKWDFRADILQKAVKRGNLNKQFLKGPFGKEFTVADLQGLSKDMTADNLTAYITAHRIHNLSSWVGNYAQQNKNRFLEDGKWQLPQSILREAIKRFRQSQFYLNDAWGKPLRLQYSKKAIPLHWGYPALKHYQLVSAGPDGAFGTKDDITWAKRPQRWAWGANWWFDYETASNENVLGLVRDQRMRLLERRTHFDTFTRDRRGEAKTAFLGKAQGKGQRGGPQSGSGGKTPPRIRDYFPETMLWQPSLITNDQGVADLAVNFADSITTWRLSASANSKGGGLGGVTAPLKVFQDFFVDIDLPVSFTQHDEVSFPVAVYNYLDGPQTVKIELKKSPWFELLEGDLVRELKLKANDVTSVRYRIKANKIGNHPFTVLAYGSKKSDAVKRFVEVAPNGERKEVVLNDRLKGNVSQTITIPQDAIPDSYKMLVRIYPGVMSQVLEGTEGMLRLPGG